MPRVIHFEIPAENPERAVKFYEEAFGWKINKWDGPVDYWIATTGEEDEPGIDGAIKDRAHEQGTVNTIGVPSIEQFLHKVLDAGGTVVQDKMAIPGVGYHAYCSDTEGNIFGVMQDDPSAQ
jgi:predicted enzyme related to lactoylglutathione lyase